MDSVNLPQNLQLLAAVFIAILGIVGALMVRGLVLKLAGLSVPEGTPGASLLALDAPDAPERTLFAETYYPRLHLGWSELFSAIRGVG